jgi:hypothetical protein
MSTLASAPRVSIAPFCTHYGIRTPHTTVPARLIESHPLVRQGWSPCNPPPARDRATLISAAGAAGNASPVSDGSNPLGARDDDVLPDSLTDALDAAAEATCQALDRGCQRCIVEILLPEFWDPLSGPVYAEEGDQQRFWKLTRRFIDNVVKRVPNARLRAIYPDAGVAAMLRNQWTDAAFEFASLNDRIAVAAEDQIVVAAAPDPPGLDGLMRIGKRLHEGQTLVLFNPRLASGDVGVGLNIRRLRESYLKEFVTTYSLRPIGDVGTVFRCYPGLWQVFVQDADVPGRFKLAAERPSRPGGEALDLIVMQALGASTGGTDGGDGQNGGPGVLQQIGLTINSLQRFMRSLSQ